MTEAEDDTCLAFKTFESQGLLHADNLHPALLAAHVLTDSKELHDARGFIGVDPSIDQIDLATFTRIVRILYMKNAGVNPYRIKYLFDALAELDGRLDFGPRMSRNDEDDVVKELEVELLKHDVTFDVLKRRGRMDYPTFEQALVETIKINKISQHLQKNGILRALATVLLPKFRNDNSVRCDDESGDGLSRLIREQADNLSAIMSQTHHQRPTSGVVSECVETFSEPSAPKSCSTDDSFSRTGSNPRPTGRRLSFFQKMTSRKGSGDLSTSGEKWWQKALVSPERSWNQAEATYSLRFLWECFLTYFHGIWEASTWKNILCFWVIWVCTCVGAVMIIWSWAMQSEEEKEKTVLRQAHDLSAFFSAEVDRAVTPLYTLALFVSRMSSLKQLADVAMNFTRLPGKTRVYYNVEPWIQQSVVDDFNGLSKEILQYAKSNAIRSLQLAPRGVLSMIYPLPGNADALGLDLLQDPNNAKDARDSILNGNYSVTGPFNLVQKIFAIVVRLPIYVPSETPGAVPLTEFPGVNGQISKNLSWWGFSSLVVDFSALLKSSKIYELSAENDLNFVMRSRSTVGDDKDTRYATTVIANNTNVINDAEAVTVEVKMPDDRWNLTVSPKSSLRPGWYSGAIAAAVLGTFLLSFISFLLLVEKRQRSMMLYRILPRHAVLQLRRRKQVVDVFDMASVFFSDLVGYTDLAGKTSPLEIVEMLNDLYTKFDKLVEKHQVCKVDTIGDAYMVIGGAPATCNGPTAAARVAKFALEALELVARSDYGIRMRAGIASGPVVAAVLGSAVPKYSFFGDTVNTASRMESTGEAGRLQVTEETKNLLEQSKCEFTIVERMHANGQTGVLVKGKGLMQTFWIRNLIREEV
eukprot:759245-Hanusia_phi.AAC.1